jgi:hypothetical protein
MESGIWGFPKVAFEMEFGFFLKCQIPLHMKMAFGWHLDSPFAFSWDFDEVQKKKITPVRDLMTF